MPAPPGDAPYAGVSIIIPAYNEALALPTLLPAIAPLGVGEVIVADNGSTDDTAAVARAHGARVVHEARKGYGAACWAGIEALSPDCRVVAFLDADMADDPARLPDLVDPILAGDCELTIGARLRRLQEPGSMTPQQHLGNMLATVLIWIWWGYPYLDLGPFRAIDRAALETVAMKDRAYGWTVEMQVRALVCGLRVRQIPVVYRRRIGVSKISGTLKGTALAGYWILKTLAQHALDAGPPER